MMQAARLSRASHESRNVDGNGHLRRCERRDRPRVCRPGEERDRIARRRDVGRHELLQQRLPRRRRIVRRQAVPEATEQSDADGIDLTQASEIAHRRVDATARRTAPHQRRRAERRDDRRAEDHRRDCVG